jgi:hypothetical protein
LWKARYENTCRNTTIAAHLNMRYNLLFEQRRAHTAVRLRRIGEARRRLRDERLIARRARLHDPTVVEPRKVPVLERLTGSAAPIARDPEPGGGTRIAARLCAIIADAAIA